MNIIYLKIDNLYIYIPPAPATRLIRTFVLQLISAHRGEGVLSYCGVPRLAEPFAADAVLTMSDYPRIPVFTGIAIDTRLSF